MRNLKCTLVAAIVLAVVFCGVSAFADHGRAPKNMILCVSDGCGYGHVDAASLFQHGRTGTQVYEAFPVRLAMATFMYGGSYEPEKAWRDFWYVTKGATESAAAATAMSTGHKTFSGAVGVDTQLNPLEHLIEKLERRGWATGVITSVEWSHATPAGFVAHNSSRNNYVEIVREMVYQSAVDVIMGCGHPLFDADGKPKLQEQSEDFKYVGGRDVWTDLATGRAAGDADGDGIGDPWVLIQTRHEFKSLMTGSTPKRVLGTAQVEKTLQEGRGGDKYADPYVIPLIETVPTLEEMTMAALNVLDDDPDGLFLLIEGGAVDWAAHGNLTGRVIEEQIDFNRAVEAVVAWVDRKSSWDETLVMVTGDHETGYLTGPGSGPTVDGPVWKPLVNNGAGDLPGVRWWSEGHTNSLVPFFAKGVGAARFKQRADQEDPVGGPYLDNTVIARTMAEIVVP
jgi:alkaline phosphatase